MKDERSIGSLNLKSQQPSWRHDRADRSDPIPKKKLVNSVVILRAERAQGFYFAGQVQLL